MIAAFCHHLNMDRSGYPRTTRSITPDAYSRVIRIADIYDALTSARSYRMKPFSSEEAMAIIAEKAGKELDPTLSAIFAEVVGVMPRVEIGVGTSGSRQPADGAAPTTATRVPDGAEKPEETGASRGSRNR